MGELCPFCGAYSPRSCEMDDEFSSETCPWLSALEDEPDPDILRDDRDERRRLAKEYPDVE